MANTDFSLDMISYYALQLFENILKSKNGYQTLSEKYPYFLYAILCLLTYKDDYYNNFYIKSYGFKYQRLNVGNEDAVIYYMPDQTIVAFRGTVITNLYNLFDIFRICEVNFQGYEVHAGFAEYTRHIEKYLIPALKANKAPLTFTGHSLGGALASLSSLYHRPKKLYTFGCPKYIKKGESFNATEITNVIDGLDFVTYLPPIIYQRLGDDIRIMSYTNPISSHFIHNYLYAIAKHYDLAILSPRDSAR